MSDLSATPQTPQETVPAADEPRSLWQALKKPVARLQDWFAIQSFAVRVMVLAMAVLIPATALYSVTLLRKQAVVAEQVKTMSVTEQAGEGKWTFDGRM